MSANARVLVVEDGMMIAIADETFLLARLVPSATA
jgi:hypothetical protein